jgi:hypothetical protein
MRKDVDVLMEGSGIERYEINVGVSEHLIVGVEGFATIVMGCPSSGCLEDSDENEGTLGREEGLDERDTIATGVAGGQGDEGWEKGHDGGIDVFDSIPESQTG